MRRGSRSLLTMWLVLLTTLGASSAVAQLDEFFADDEEDAGPVEVSGNVKTFSVLSVPTYEHLLLGSDPVVMGATAGRLIVRVDGGEYLQAEVHPLVVATSAGLAGGNASGITQLGVGGARPEAVDLSILPVDSPYGAVTAIIDRAFLRLKLPNVDVTLGRQPVSFGQGFFFTPMDIVSPFSPATLDREFKPGVDAVRGDVFFGQATQVSLVAAYHDGFTLDGVVFAGHARTNVLGIDVGLFGSRAHESWIGGFDLAGDAFGVGIRGEVTGTVPDDERELPFLRGVVGADLRYNTISVSAELYAQTLGARDPKNYLSTFGSERFARGELFLAGQLYGAVMASWQVMPMLTPGISVMANVLDQSVLISPSLAWSVSDEVDVSVGAQIPQGRPADDVELADLVDDTGQPLSPEAMGNLIRPRSEFGLYPATGFVQISAAF